MPPAGTQHVVLTHAVARMLGWSNARVRSTDDVLKPTRAADGTRLYDVDRVLNLVFTMDEADRLPRSRLVWISKHAPRRDTEIFSHGRWYRITYEPARRRS